MSLDWRVELNEEDRKYYFNFLNALRESGRVNMFGAAKVLEEEEGLSRHAARDILQQWMDDF